MAKKLEEKIKEQNRNNKNKTFLNTNQAFERKKTEKKNT